jgi:hypothetical protein
MADERGARMAPPEVPDCADRIAAARLVRRSVQPRDGAGRTGPRSEDLPRSSGTWLSVNVFKVWPRFAIAARGRGR